MKRGESSFGSGLQGPSVPLRAVPLVVFMFAWCGVSLE